MQLKGFITDCVYSEKYSILYCTLLVFGPCIWFACRWSGEASASGDNRGDGHPSSLTRLPVSRGCSSCGQRWQHAISGKCCE